ncbi:MAG: hypothetical protein ABIQ86_12775 [Steroidobacteraceae bacterium]
MVRAQLAKIDEDLEGYEFGANLLPVDEAVERAIANTRTLRGQARHRLLGFRQAASTHLGSLEDLLALDTEDDLRKKLTALFKADGRGEGVPLAKHAGQHEALRIKRGQLLAECYLLTWELMEQGLYVEMLPGQLLPWEQFPRIVEQLA